MGLVVALPLSAIAIVVYPFVTRTAPQEDLGDVPPRTIDTVLFGVALVLLVTLTSVGAGAIGVTVLAALYPALPGKRLVGSDITPHASRGPISVLAMSTEACCLRCCAGRSPASSSARDLRALCLNACYGRSSPLRCATRRTRSTRNEGSTTSSHNRGVWSCSTPSSRLCYPAS